MRRGFALFLVLFSLASCKSCKTCEQEDESEEEEERNREREHYWRVRIHIVGAGRVKTFVGAFDCASDGAAQSGTCGPKLVKYKELAPATMEATAAKGHRFDHWESQITAADGSVHPRQGPMPDGRVYINGMGYSDTGDLETVTAVFVADAD